MSEKQRPKSIIKRIVHIEMKNGKRTEHEFTKEEIEQWKKQHEEEMKNAQSIKRSVANDSTGI